MSGALFNAPTAGRPFEIVPPELLARPERDELRRLDRAEAALVVDGYLRRLSSQVAPSVAVAAPPQAIVPPLPPGAGLAVDTALDECAESGRTMDGEAAVTFRLRCPRWVPPLWRDAVELARRVAGESLAPWRAAEAIAAEGLSAPTQHGAVAPDIEVPRPPPLRAAANPDETRAAFTARSAFDTIDWSYVVEAVPQDVDRLADDVAA